jgi:hypothetical protein
MLLERMRILDMAHNWSPGTITQYRGKLNLIRRFEQNFHCPILRVPFLPRPPATESIPLMWAQQQYSLQDRQWTRSTAITTSDEKRVSFSTVRAIRSAASLYNTWLAMVEHPGQVVRERDTARPIQVNGCLPTDGLDYTLMTNGMSRRLGVNAKPAVALLLRHVIWMNAHYDRIYRTTTNPQTKREAALAGFLNLLAWLAWLRGGECFGVRWTDIDVILPGSGPAHNLAKKIGALKIRLLEQTKSCRSSVADIVISFTSGSGLPIGQWLLRARGCTHPSTTASPDCLEDWKTDQNHIFCHQDGRIWDSNYYRSTFLLPCLQLQRMEGDPYLQHLDGSPGNTLAEAFYSMHTYRIGARSTVSRKQEGCTRKATLEEINEHGRWRYRRSSESMAEQYRQWDLDERLSITLLCM